MWGLEDCEDDDQECLDRNQKAIEALKAGKQTDFVLEECEESDTECLARNAARRAAMGLEECEPDDEPCESRNAERVRELMAGYSYDFDLWDCEEDDEECQKHNDAI